jgi:hypothetical protein
MDVSQNGLLPEKIVVDPRDVFFFAQVETSPSAGNETCQCIQNLHSWRAAVLMHSIYPDSI